MRIPMKVDYGVRALVELAQNPTESHISTAEIASRQDIPEPYLDQLLSMLHKFGFIQSRRGPQGGHTLAKNPEEIDLEMVMTSLEGSGTPLVCLEHPDECSLSGNCAQRDMWQVVEDTVHNVLRSTSIADLVNRQNPRASRGVYAI